MSSFDTVRGFWENPGFDLVVEADRFLTQPWEGGDPPPAFFICFGELHINKFKEGTPNSRLKLLKEKCELVWQDCLLCIKMATSFVKEGKVFSIEESTFLTLQVLPLGATPSCYARQCKFSASLYLKEGIEGLAKQQKAIKKLYAILAGKETFPENSAEARQFELVLTRSMALTRISDSGKLLEFNWIDLVEKFGSLYPNQRPVVDGFIQRLKLRKEYDMYFEVFKLHREIDSRYKPLDFVNGENQFKRFVNTINVEELGYFALKIPPEERARFEAALFDTQDEEEKTNTLSFFRFVEKRLGTHYERQELLPLIEQFLEQLDLLFKPDSSLKEILLAALLYTITCERLRRLKFPPLGIPWGTPFFQLCLKTTLEEKKELFEKLFSLPACTKVQEGDCEHRVFLLLHVRNWLKPAHLLWIFFNELQLDFTSTPLVEKLKSEQVIHIIDQLHRYLGTALSSEHVRSLFGGNSFSVSTLDIPVKLANWRNFIAEQVNDNLPAYLLADLERRRKELDAEFEDKTHFSKSKMEVCKVLWYSTYFPPLHYDELLNFSFNGKNILEKVNRDLELERLNELTKSPSGEWFSSTQVFGEGPHLRCQWHKREEKKQQLEMIYSPSLLQQATMRLIFTLEIEDAPSTNRLTWRTYLGFVEHYVKNLGGSEFSVPQFHALQSTHPSQAVKMSTFFKSMKIAVRNWPRTFVENSRRDFNLLTLKALLLERHTYELKNGAGVSLLPPDHTSSSLPEYCLLRRNYENFIFGFVQSLPSFQPSETILEFPSKIVKVGLKVESKPIMNPHLFIISATTVFNEQEYRNQIAFPMQASDELKSELILGLLAQLKSQIYFEWLSSGAMHLQ